MKEKEQVVGRESGRGHRSQVMLGFASHGKYFGIYLKNDGRPLRSYKLGSGYANRDIKPIGTALGVGLKFNPKFNSWRQAH